MTAVLAEKMPFQCRFSLKWQGFVGLKAYHRYSSTKGSFAYIINIWVVLRLVRWENM